MGSIPIARSILYIWLDFPIIINVGKKSRKKSRAKKQGKIRKEDKVISKQDFDESTSKSESLSALLSEPEPWESWETQLVSYSIVLAIIGLIILGILINLFIL